MAELRGFAAYWAQERQEPLCKCSKAHHLTTWMTALRYAAGVAKRQADAYPAGRNPAYVGGWEDASKRLATALASAREGA